MIKIYSLSRFFFAILPGLLLSPALFAAEEGTAGSVSYYREIVPIFKRSCSGCHHPGKLKGELDLTTHAALSKGGKHGVIIKPGDPKSSSLIEEISGEEPEMPKEGDPLSKEEVALIEHWILQGAKDDTPADKLNPYKISEPPVYEAPAVITSVVYSPDGETLAISGYHEVLLYKSDGSELAGRLLGESPKIESLAFSSDGKLLAVSGGAPAVFGEIQVWNVPEKKMVNHWRVSNDSLYGISFSPDNTKVAFGGADKSVRILEVSDGKELVKFDNHSDWIFATTFSVDGKRLLSGSRDKAMKLIDAQNGQFIDDINKLVENVLCFSRNPKEDVVAYGGEQGTARIYKMKDNQNRTAANNDVNLIKQLERQPGAIHAIAYNPEGTQIAIGSTIDEVRIYKPDGTRTATLKGHQGAVFSIAWHPKKPEIVTGGYEGKLRIFNPADGNLIKEFVPFPIKSSNQVAAK
jgi:WD40 repeat protein